MRPKRDYVHAQFGTRESLLSEARFVSVIEQAEAFNAGSPFTLCRCSSLGKGDINLTGAVRQRLIQEHWVPESGAAELAVLAPANGRWLVLEMRLPVDPGHVAEVHYHFEPSYFSEAEREATLDFLRQAAESLSVVYGYAHHALDEALQDTTDPKQYRALTGSPPPVEPIDISGNPGRSAKAGQLLITCRWLSFLGGELLEKIGLERPLTAPCTHEELRQDLLLLRLYDDPMSFDRPEHRRTQATVRQHLGLDDLTETVRWEAVERRPTGQSAVPPQEAPPAQPAQAKTPPSTAPSEPLPLRTWLALSRGAAGASAEAVAFFTAQARRAAGRVLEIGCGSGHITIPVARTGLPVVGVDDSPIAIEHLRGRLGLESAALQGRTTLVLGDIRDIDLGSHGPYSAISIPYQGVNRFSERDTLRELLDTLRQNLQPGGVLAFDTFFPRTEWWAPAGRAVPRLLDVQLDSDSPEAYLLHEAVEAEQVTQRLKVTRRLDRLDTEGHVVRQRYLRVDLAYFYPNELRYLLELSGFDSSIHGGYSGESLASPEQPVVVVAKRI